MSRASSFMAPGLLMAVLTLFVLVIFWSKNAPHTGASGAGGPSISQEILNEEASLAAIFGKDTLMERHKDMTFEKCFEKARTEPPPFAKMVIAPKPCQNHVNMIVLVKSSLLRSDQRRLIRHSWAKNLNATINGHEISTRAIFILGVAPNKQYVNPALKAESRAFDDILQFDFTDGYTLSNLVDKPLNAFRFIKRFCPRVKIILMGDDDTIIAPWTYLNIVPFDQVLKPGAMFYGGFPFRMHFVPRSGMRYSVPENVYPCQSVPVFLMAMALVLSTDTTEKFLEASRTSYYSKYFLDDIYFSWLATTMNLTFTKFSLEYYDARCLSRGAGGHKGALGAKEGVAGTGVAATAGGDADSADKNHQIQFIDNLAVVHECDHMHEMTTVWGKFCDSNLPKDETILNLHKIYCKDNLDRIIV